jgi:outer membrane protein assembly factor BamB
MASPSPVTDGAHVWAMTGQGDVVAFDFDGAEIWRRNLQKDYGPSATTSVSAVRRLLHENRLIVPILHGMKTDDPVLPRRARQALGRDPLEGRTADPRHRESPDAYITPQVLRRGDTDRNPRQRRRRRDRPRSRNRQLNPGASTGSTPAIRGTIASSAPSSSPAITSSPPPASSPCSPSVPNPRARCNASTSSGRVGAPTCRRPSATASYLWIVDDRGAFRAVDVATGKDLYRPQRLARGTYSASLVMADGKIFATSEDGITTVLEAGPEFRCSPRTTSRTATRFHRPPSHTAKSSSGHPIGSIVSRRLSTP